MTELSLQPLLLLHVPPCHEVDPQALADLLELVSEGYGASVLVNPRTSSEVMPPPLLLGRWGDRDPGDILLELQPTINRVFFNLDWLAGVS
ncbi:hypothetical protein GCM10008955_29650 [Deinococcus malanensis]|uniref:Uncharacterized protein n=1 Tax=Deinococcus malanensis TaxID=1706855 RepID=A0ABQ2EYR6_9DEIO|nr:hypothetical protein [Deinococcus malanensis]GGK33664.1 hypothetical protein GCM10008955_29650 [Deinococcus malanensis]